MPSPMCQIAVNDSAYADDLRAKGFSTIDSVTYAGKTYSHDEIAGIVDESYQRHRPEFAVVCGGKPRVERRRERDFKRAVANDVGSGFGISPWTIGMALLLGFLGGPMALVLAIVTALFSWYLQRDLNGDTAMLAAMGAA